MVSVSPHARKTIFAHRLTEEAGVVDAFDDGEERGDKVINETIVTFEKYESVS